jgi:hypothetical protein
MMVIFGPNIGGFVSKIENRMEYNLWFHRAVAVLYRVCRQQECCDVQKVLAQQIQHILELLKKRE